MRVLITRPEADTASLAAALAGRGHEVLIEPLLAIVPVADAAIDLAGVQALVMTSANGARVLAGLTPRRDLPVFAVGDATAAAAHAAGFPAVESAKGDVGDLAVLVGERLDPAKGLIFHGAARQRAGDLKGHLESLGFSVRRAILYEARPAAALSENLVAALRCGQVDAALFFSPRTGDTFVRLISEDRLTTACDRIYAVCLSPAVADKVAGLPWRAMAVAAAPTQAALLDSLADLERRESGRNDST